MHRGLGEFVKMIFKAWLITINFIHNVAINNRICLTFFGGNIYIYIANNNGCIHKHRNVQLKVIFNTK
jgi:hypothetical protein